MARKFISFNAQEKLTVHFRALSKLRAKTVGYPQIQDCKIQLREKKIEMSIHIEIVFERPLSVMVSWGHNRQIACSFKLELLHFLTTQTEL